MKTINTVQIEGVPSEHVPGVESEYLVPRNDETASEVTETDDAVSNSAVITARSEITAKAKKHKRLVGIAAGAMSIVCVIITVGLSWLIAKYGDKQGFWDKQFPILTAINLLSLLTASMLLMWNHIRIGRTMRGHAQTLSQDLDPESLGSWIDLFKFDDLEMHVTAKKHLTALLPTLRANDATMLSAEHRARLNWFLGWPPEQLGDKDIREFFSNTIRRETDFRIAILEAYKQVGGADALTRVEWLAKTKGKTESQRRIQAAAQDCLPYLKINIEKQTCQNSLLRGSSINNAGEETLLRPVVSSQTTAPMELLRPI